MLTLHRVRGVRRTPDGAPAAGHAVLVDGGRIAAIGPYEELLAAHGDQARVREWDGVLTPGRTEPDAAALLETVYHPDPREAGELGEEPVGGEALAALDMTAARWGAGARRGLQRLLSLGTTALTGPFTRPAVRTAVRRSGLAELPAGRGRTLTVGGAADFAVFAADGSCLATVLAGRLVYRRR
ncbi:imidazolonepropionase-like domain-containing protein [Streptomyces kronopolitis]|uniref:imidazolonepropionase-like domain-containing protein n=1 Tax=Streptomyces kronopolitis TaxID=1612435 RepID=UPI003D969BB9